MTSATRPMKTENTMLGKEANNKRPDNVQFHLYKMECMKIIWNVQKGQIYRGGKLPRTGGLGGNGNRKNANGYWFVLCLCARSHSVVSNSATP